MHALGSWCFVLCYTVCAASRSWVTTDELENHISPEDLEEFMKMHRYDGTTSPLPDHPLEDFDDSQPSSSELPSLVDCFGLGGVTQQLRWLFNMRPASSDSINTHFYFASRMQPDRRQVWPGEQFGLEWVDFDPNRKTVMIIHGFMSHSNASWVREMTKAFLQWDDVNVISVDWSRGGNTWKYWRAVANTRTVGADVTDFLRQLCNATGADPRSFHFVGHSLGAHISSYVAYQLGGVHRITGLDPAQPCFRTSDRTEKLDETDADFVDVIHTNGRLLSKIGFGLPEPTGHADFYPNGGMKQPGCNTTRSMWSKLLPSFMSPHKLKQAICSHGRAYLLFTESLIATNCSFRGHQWNLTYEGVNASLTAACNRLGSCSEMGIRAIGDRHLPRANGPYFVLTTEKKPYCPTEWQRHHPQPELLRDLQNGFRLDRTTTPSLVTSPTIAYADPFLVDSTTVATTRKNWLQRWFG